MKTVPMGYPSRTDATTNESMNWTAGNTSDFPKVFPDLAESYAAHEEEIKAVPLFPKEEEEETIEESHTTDLENEEEEIVEQASRIEAETSQEDTMNTQTLNPTLDTTAIQEDESLLNFDDFIPEDLEKMLSKSNLWLGILGGLLASVVSSLLWVESGALLEEYFDYDHKYAYMAILVGLCVGLGVRILGKGSTWNFGLIAIVITLIGSLMGTLCNILVHVVKAFGVSYLEVLEIFDLTFLQNLLIDRFQYLDILFYVLAVGIAYFLAIRKDQRNKKWFS